jgi:two-component system, NtrC family, sensor kinase
MGSLFHNLRLRTKIIATVTVVIISVLAVSTYIGHFFIQLPVEEDQYHRAVELAFSNSDRFARRGIFPDPALLAQEFQIIQRDHQDVLDIAVYAHGARHAHSLVLATSPGDPLMELDAQPMVRQMFEYDSPFEGLQSIETGSGKGLCWIVSSEIIEGGHPVGCLNLKVSKSGINVVSRQMIKYNVAVLLLAILAIVALLSLLFSRLVNKPIERLLEAMEQAEAGALNTRVDVHRDDELGIIASRFNRMMDQVTALNEELSTRVAEATQELRERNVELTRINEELFETQRMLARSERLAIAGQLAASLAHEIGTPLNAISGHVQLLTKTLGPKDEAARKRLKIIETQIDHIVRVVKDLLASTRDITLAPTPADLNQFLEEFLLFATPTLDMKGIQVETALDHTLPRVLFDALRLQQVFLNLINNSIDAMPNGGTLRLRSYLSRSSRGEGVAGIEYSDTGGGIPKENLSRIFEPTFTTKRIGSGAGFGLAISRQIMKAHGGTISAESPEGGGARFILELPLAVAEPTYAESLEHTRR